MPTYNYKFLRNEEKYWDSIRALRNKLNSSGGFIEDVFITEEMQNLYMKQHSKNFFVCLVDDIFAGYIGVIDNDIRIAVEPDMAGKGIGGFMLDNIQREFPSATARVLEGNDASKALFEKSGFKLRWYYYERE